MIRAAATFLVVVLLAPFAATTACELICANQEHHGAAASGERAGCGEHAPAPEAAPRLATADVTCHDAVVARLSVQLSEPAAGSPQVVAAGPAPYEISPLSVPIVAATEVVTGAHAPDRPPLIQQLRV